MENKKRNQTVKNPNELLNAKAFIQELKKEYNITIDRRTLQFYGSPKLRLIPLPTYRGGHVAHYPIKDVRRVAVIKKLQEKSHLDLATVKAIFEIVPKEYIYSPSTPLLDASNPAVSLIGEGVRDLSINQDNIKQILDKPISAFLKLMIFTMIISRYVSLLSLCKYDTSEDGKNFTEKIKKVGPDITRKFLFQLEEVSAMLVNKQFQNTLKKLLESAAMEVLNKVKTLSNKKDAHLEFQPSFYKELRKLTCSY